MPDPTPRSLRITNELAVSLVREAGKLDGDVLDLGAGNGYLTSLLVRSPEQRHGGGHVEACDIEGSKFSVPDVNLTICDANEGLPFGDETFDAVATLEVLEHTRLPYAVLGEIYRVLKPGGVLVFSVPNVGHMISRLNFLGSGHYEIYPSPSALPENCGHICGHVSPLPFQYWHYGLRTGGFSNIRLYQDRMKKGAAFFTAVLWPLLKGFTVVRLKRLARDAALYDETSSITRHANSWTVLTSRSLVFRAQKLA